MYSVKRNIGILHLCDAIITIREINILKKTFFIGLAKSIFYLSITDDRNTRGRHVFISINVEFDKNLILGNGKKHTL